MPRTYEKIKPQDLDLEENIKKAVAAVKDECMSVRAAAKMYNVGRMTVQRRVTEPEKPLKSVGGQLSLLKEAEMDLAECLKVKAKWGFGNSITEIKSFVKTYVDTNITEDTPGVHPS